MRGYKTAIQEAELLAMSPEAVSEFLKLRAEQSQDEARDDPVDQETEQALRSRSHQLIDLALARYGRYMKTVAGLFQNEEAGNAIRLACLSNTSLGEEIFRPFPVGLLGEDPEMAKWIGQASDEDLSALFENPTLSDSFLSGLLERGKGWESVSNDKLRLIVSILHRNPRMRTPRQDDYMDGYAEYSYGAVFNAAWSLAATVETNESWAYSLGWLYEQLETEAFSINDPLAIVARWQVDASDEETVEKESRNNASGWLSNKQRVRKGLARLALSKSRDLLDALLTNEDVALRCAAYAVGEIKPDQLAAAYERDGELVFNQSIRNLSLWHSSNTRAALKNVAWNVVRADKRSDLLAANIYNSMLKDMQKKYPEWFKDDEDSDSHFVNQDQLPATKADIAALSERFDQYETAHSSFFEEIKQSFQTLNSRVGWIWWFSLGALLASLRHF